MKIYVDEQNRIRAVHSALEGLRAVDTDVFDGWPLSRVLCYCYDDSKGIAIYPYVRWPAVEAIVGMGAEQQAMLAGLGVPADENMAGHAAAVREGMDVALRDLPDNSAYDVKVLARKWAATKADGEPSEHVTGDKRTFDGLFYKCLQDHTVHDPAWTPKDAPSLWAEIPDPSDEWPLIPNSILATAPWMKGQKGRTADERRWVSLIDNNVWQPSEYPAGWEEQA